MKFKRTAMVMLTNSAKTPNDRNMVRDAFEELHINFPQHSRSDDWEEWYCSPDDADRVAAWLKDRGAEEIQ